VLAAAVVPRRAPAEGEPEERRSGAHVGRDERVAALERVRLGRREVVQRVEDERERLAVEAELREEEVGRTRSVRARQSCSTSSATATGRRRRRTLPYTMTLSSVRPRMPLISISSRSALALCTSYWVEWPRNRIALRRTRSRRACEDAVLSPLAFESEAE